MKELTVFTPTYNRAYCLHQCYESLVAQTCQNFTWLIIDDGSKDDTRYLVQKWIDEGKIDIDYQYQENQGMHGGHNTAYKIIDTELNMCIDSDDYMPPDAVEKILTKWYSLEHKDALAGIMGLDAFKNGNIIGNSFPEHLETTTLEDLYFKYKISGDKKLVLRTATVKEYDLYPIYPDERFVPLGTLYLRIDKDYELACLNEILCVVEYMEDGSSRNIFKQYRRHPKGFQFARLNAMKYSNYFNVRFKNAIQYISHSIQLRDKKFLKKSPRKALTLGAIPFGIVMYAYVKYLNRKTS